MPKRINMFEKDVNDSVEKLLNFEEMNTIGCRIIVINHQSSFVCVLCASACFLFYRSACVRLILCTHSFTMWSELSCILPLCGNCNISFAYVIQGARHKPPLINTRKYCCCYDYRRLLPLCIFIHSHLLFLLSSNIPSARNLCNYDCCSFYI